MKTLCWDTSTAVTAVALLEGERVIAEDRSPSPDRHGNTLLPRIQQQLAAAGWDRLEVALLAVGLGPGSFTGLRIGLATAKGWALATGVPLVGVSSHAGVGGPLLAAGASPVVVVTDAFKGEVYVSVFSDAGGAPGAPEVVLEPFHALPEAAARRVAAACPEGSLTLVGDGLRRYPEPWSPVLGSRAAWADPPADTPCPVTLARLAAVQYKQAGPGDLATLEPLYMRDSDAKLPNAPLAL